jgi:hypothetical protein
MAVEQDYFSPEDACVRLGVSPEALRARIRRCQRREGRDVVARLGGGIVAVKLGALWRVRFPKDEVP